jgi:ectoine hydroxylase-related dioxygenase (phytanoyl-CoA dioxygenase family)
MHVGPAVFNLLTNPRLLDVAESIVGPDIYSNPVQHIRMKLPKRAVATGSYNGLVEKVIWHQDNGVILPEADESTILTVWLPLSDATVENGCLAVIPRSHRDDLMPHCPTKIGTGIPTALLPLERETPVPMKAGSILLMTSRTVHQSLDNLTDDEVRLSFDLRYQPIGHPTGRPMFPGFLARSVTHPEATLTNAAEWARLWYETRARMAERENPSFNRWSADSPLCA